MEGTVYETQLLQTPSRHQLNFTSYIDSTLNSITESITSASRSPLAIVGEKLITGLLSRIVHGCLRIMTPRGRAYVFPIPSKSGGSSSPNPSRKSSRSLEVTLYVRNESFWTRILLGSDMGFAEAYMNGDVDCDDIGALLRLFIVNKEYISVDTPFSKLFSFPKFVTRSRFLGSIDNTQANISAHYDLGNLLFAAFLSCEMAYSCPIYSLSDPGETLESAQERKFQYHIRQAQIKDGHHVLEIGSGWGALAMMILEAYPNCTVDTLTLSVHQKAYAEKHIAAAGLSDKIKVHLMDYRAILDHPEWEHAFDRVISVEMIEAVGKEYLETYWRVLDWALKEHDAVGVVQSITLPEARIGAYDEGVDFIQKWIFIGCYMPSLSLLMSTLNTGAQGRFVVDKIINIGPDHYPPALAKWRENFLQNFESLVIPALKSQFQLSDAGVETFRRKWIYYFCYAEEGFAARLVNDHIITFTREGNPGLDFLF